MKISGLPIRTLLAAAMTAALSQAALAEFSVTGSRDDLQVKAREAQLDEVLSTLRERYGLIYRTETPLTQTISGNYSGSLESVVSQLTRRYDHALKTTHGTVELVFTNQVKSTAKPPPLTAPAPSNGNVSAVTAALQTQAQQIVLANATSSSQAAGGSSSGGAIAAGNVGGPTGAGPAASPSTSPSSMAQMTQQASATVRELASALSRISIPR